METGQSPWVALKRSPYNSSDLFDALDIARFCSIHFNFVAFINEGRNLYDQAGFQCGWLADCAGGGFLQGRLSAHYF